MIFNTQITSTTPIYESNENLIDTAEQIYSSSKLSKNCMVLRLSEDSFKSVRDNQQRSLLDRAVDTNNIPIIQLLLEAKHSPIEKTNDIHAIHRAFEQKSPLSLQAIVQKIGLPDPEELLIDEEDPAHYLLGRKKFKHLTCIVEQAKESLSEVVLFEHQVSLIKKLITGRHKALLNLCLAKIEPDDQPTDEWGRTATCLTFTKNRIDLLPLFIQNKLRSYFQFSLGKSAWHRVLEQFLGENSKKYLGAEAFTDRGCKINYIYPLFAYTLLHFAERVSSYQLLSTQTVTANFFKEIQIAFLVALTRNAALLLKRIKSNKPTIVETGYSKHSVVIAFLGKNILFCNRGETMSGQKRALELYEYDTNKLDEKTLSLLLHVSDGTKRQGDSIIYTKFKKIISCTFPGEALNQLIKKPIKPQKTGNCVVASGKLAVRVFLYLLFFKSSENDSENDSEKAERCYKDFSVEQKNLITREYESFKKDEEFLSEPQQ